MAAAGQDVANAPPPLRTMMERHLLPLVNHIKFKECLLAHSTCSSNTPATECWCRHALIEPEEQTDLPERDHAAEVRAEYQCITPNHQCVSSFPAEPLWHVPAQARLSAMTGSIGSKHPSRQDAAGKDSPNRHSKVSLCPTPPHPTLPCPALPHPGRGWLLSGSFPEHMTVDGWAASGVWSLERGSSSAIAMTPSTGAKKHPGSSPQPDNL